MSLSGTGSSADCSLTFLAYKGFIRVCAKVGLGFISAWCRVYIYGQAWVRFYLRLASGFGLMVHVGFRQVLLGFAWCWFRVYLGLV